MEADALKERGGSRGQKICGGRSHLCGALQQLLSNCLAGATATAVGVDDDRAEKGVVSVSFKASKSENLTLSDQAKKVSATLNEIVCGQGFGLKCSHKFGCIGGDGFELHITALLGARNRTGRGTEQAHR